MGIEQSDNEERAQNRLKDNERKKTQDFFESKKLTAQTSQLLQNLAQQIADDFGIDVLEVKNLISSSTTGNLDNLKSGISSNETINLSDLQSAINSAKGKIEELSKQHRDSLKDSLEIDTYLPHTHQYFTSTKILPDSILQKAYHPQNMGDHVIGAGIGIFDSTEAVILFTYSLGKGILLTPYHIYLILTGKGKYQI